MVSVEIQTDPVPTPEPPTSAADSTTSAEEMNGDIPAPSLLEELQKKVADLEEDKKEKESQIAEMQE